MMFEIPRVKFVIWVGDMIGDQGVIDRQFQDGTGHQREESMVTGLQVLIPLQAFEKERGTGG